MASTSDVMTLAEAKERFAGNWLATEVVRRDRQRNPTHVRLIAKSRSHAQLCKKIRSVREACIFFAGPLFPKDAVIIL